MIFFLARTVQRKRGMRRSEKRLGQEVERLETQRKEVDSLRFLSSLIRLII